MRIPLVRDGNIFRFFGRLLLVLSLFSCALQAALCKTRLPVIQWQSSTLQLVQRGGDYARMVRLADRNIACAFDRAGKILVRLSLDDGKTWQDPVLIAEDPDCWLTNAELLVLNDGTLLYFWNERPRKAVENQAKKAPPGFLTRPFLIRMARSSDHGRTWSTPRTLYKGGTSYDDGCWEPAGIQLPSGEVHVYFANETAFAETSEQEIALLRSCDGGKIWSAPERVAFRKDHRDGMPSPLLLANSSGIAVAIEDNGVDGDRFKPSIIFTPLENNWRSGFVGSKSTNRWPALAQPLPTEWYAGAPCLRQLPSGETLLSFQESSDGSLRRCRMTVAIGDSNVRGFTNKSYPFPLGPTGNQAWNSLFIKDAQTIVAVSTATLNGTRGIWSIEGKVMRD